MLRELAALARQEIDDLKRRDEPGLAADVLGLLTAAGGPLSVEDLAVLTVAGSPVCRPDASDYPAVAHRGGGP